MCVCGGRGGCPGQFILIPHPPGYASKIILLILFIFYYLNVKMYKLKHNSSQIQPFSLSHCFIC